VVRASLKIRRSSRVRSAYSISYAISLGVGDSGGGGATGDMISMSVCSGVIGGLVRGKEEHKSWRG
jgi:hypothetical protein